MPQESFDPHFFNRAKEAYHIPHASATHSPPKTWEMCGSKENSLLGQKALSDGKIGCIVLAGGQGTRLGFPGPKGCAPVTTICHKSLYQLLAEKTIAASQLYGRALPLGIMTSTSNDLETREFFKKNHYFGLDPHQLTIFPQEDWPFLDDKGEPLINPKTQQPFLGPNGNGDLFHAMQKSGTLDAWDRLGITHFNIVLIDNPLGDPFDAELIGFHLAMKDDFTLKCIKRSDPMESVGVIVWQADKPFVVEYSELSEGEKNARESDGSFLFPLANISLFASSMKFARTRARTDDLPLHAQKKKVSLDGTFGWKIETYLFDHITFAAHTHLLVYPREDVFSPLKNSKSPHSFDDVQKALYAQDRKVWQALTGKQAPEKPFELSPFFYYPTESIKGKWQGASMPPTDYVTP